MPVTDFTSGLEGWTTDNFTATHVADGGNPGGYARGVEGGSSVWCFVAPVAYLGDQEALYGGTFSYDQQQDITKSRFSDIDVILVGGGLILVAGAGANPGTDWTHYSLDLELGGGWKVSSLGGRVATEGEILTVLGDLTAIKIRGEFVEGTSGDASGLDNVEMIAGAITPPPALSSVVESTFNSDVEG